ncbi:hypothetical protein N7478_002459 [Penicillium angulare]|uniref:uncharacterized protein n=1 Tax=Penicillium angulare TaxID=116970 RepID=UPI0025422C85|nr:uncharacterized protein N7478_002459 [Penicillium angulare]KAJ5286773.1 hypothetical protein N7478_002459 [Penicillium angulare]
MVNIFQRFLKRAPSSSAPPVAGSGTQNEQSHALHRTTSANSAKRSRPHDLPAENPVPRHLILISDTPEFDPEIIRRFQAEAFQVQYLPFISTGELERDRKNLEYAVHEKEDDLEAGERFAIVAYNWPAYCLLASHHLIASNTNPFPRLCALIAYHPLSSMKPQKPKKYIDGQETCVPACSDTENIFKPGPSANLLPIQIHLPGQKPNACAFWPWIALSASEGDVTYKKRHRCHVFGYPDSPNGFSEQNPSTRSPKNKRKSEENSGTHISSSVAWSRTLGCLRRAFGAGCNWPAVAIETVWEEYWQHLLTDLDIAKGLDEDNSASWSVMQILGGHRDMQDEEGISLECIPTQAGGSDPQSLRDFFKNTYIPSGPTDQHIRLLSRTVGTDRIVDEISFSFHHTADVPWLLPGVSPTNRDISVVVVVVATFRADRIVNQKLYWDQADVLVQAGILDSALVPKMKAIV